MINIGLLQEHTNKWIYYLVGLMRLYDMYLHDHFLIVTHGPSSHNVLFFVFRIGTELLVIDCLSTRSSTAGNNQFCIQNLQFILYTTFKFLIINLFDVYIPEISSFSSPEPSSSLPLFLGVLALDLVAEDLLLLLLLLLFLCLV